MTNYYFTSSEDPLARTAWQEAKEKRRKVLAAVRRRRRESYIQFLQRQKKRHRLQASGQ